MSICSIVCRRVAHHGLSYNHDHIWISDEILSAALHRFSLSRPHRRNGSSVPGPLEASRRLAKRRMMGLTMAGGGAGLDIGALFGVDGDRSNRPCQWQAPAVPTDSENSSISLLGATGLL